MKERKRKGRKERNKEGRKEGRKEGKKRARNDVSYYLAHDIIIQRLSL